MSQISYTKFPTGSGGYFGVRHFQFLLLFFATIIVYGMRTNLSVGVVAMINSNSTDNPDVPFYPEFEDTKELMLSSFFWGYICLQIGAGQLAERFGPKRFLCGSVFLTSLFSILIPVMADKIGYIGVIVCRVAQGLSQGFIYPSLHHLVSHWSSIRERAKIVAYTYAGGPLGTVISMIVTGAISSSWVGWPVAFYLYGALGFGWVILFFFLGCDSPEQYKYISQEELDYIREGSEKSEHKKPEGAPWKSIATSAPMWALLITHCGQNWGFWTLLNEIPTYLDKMLEYDIKNNGLLSGTPYLVHYVLSLIFSPIADYLIVKKYVSIGVSRKIFNSIGLFIPAVALIILSFVGRDQKGLVVALLIVAVGVNSATFSGFNVNHMDLSPNYAGTLMGITNGFSNILSIIAPLFVMLLKNQGLTETDSELWVWVFCFAAGVNFVTGFIFVIFGSGEVQPWNEIKSKK